MRGGQDDGRAILRKNRRGLSSQLAKRIDAGKPARSRGKEREGLKELARVRGDDPFPSRAQRKGGEEKGVRDADKRIGNNHLVG